MSTKQSKKFKVPLKRKQTDTCCETLEKKSDKPEVKPSIANKDKTTADKSSIVDIDHKTEDFKSPLREDTTEDTSEALRGDDGGTQVVSFVQTEDTVREVFVFVSANGQQMCIPNKLIDTMSKKFRSVEDTDSDSHKSDDQLVPEISNDQMIKEMLENEEFITELAEDF